MPRPRTPRITRRALALALALALAVAAVATAAPASHASGADCAPTDPVCFDALPADTAWEQSIGLTAVPHKYQGSGVVVASLDTGVTPGPDLGLRLLARADFTSERDGLDHFGHGSHMAGLIAGDGTSSDERFQGSAPEAGLVSVKVAGWDGATDVSTVIAALEWVVANRARFAIRVVNLSWGTDAVRGTGADPLDLAVERAWRAGLVVVVAAGNAGPGAGTVAKPADDPYVITVGAADTAGTVDRDDDALAPFSSRGPTVDAIDKPDLLAPGVSLVSDRAAGSTIDSFRPAARLGELHFKGSGSSQAAAVVSGIAARMIDANPDVTNDQIKAALMRTADRRIAGPGTGAGIVDAAAAVAAVVPRKRGVQPVLPSANHGLTPSAGAGPIDPSRGSLPVVTDLDGDGVAEPVSGEVDAFGDRWDGVAYAQQPWTAATWDASAWAGRVTETLGDAPTPAPTGPAGPMLAWESGYWGATSATIAGWDAKYWGAKYWGAKYWGTGLWQ